MRDKLNLALSLALATAVVFGGLYVLWPQTPISEALSRMSAQVAGPFIRAPDPVPPAKPVQRTVAATPTVPRPQAPAAEPPTASVCPPGQVAGHFESERTGTRIICHTPSFEESTRPAATYRAPARPVPVYREQAPQYAQQSSGYTCAWLKERVNYLDSLARQPQSGRMQDWIRGERKIARDQQRDLRC
jgi:hypothetical protein